MQRRDADAIVVLVRDDAEVARWPLSGLGRPDLAVADRLARLLLGARRLGCSIRLHDACPELTELLDLVGLGDVVADVALRQTVGEAEGGEQTGVEEVVVADDPIA